MSGTSAGRREPPLTNRGVLRPDDRLAGGVDYLNLTVWATPEEVREVLERGVLDRYGWSSDPLDPTQEWVESPAGGRVESMAHSGSVSVATYRPEVLGQSMFCSVEVKGEACAHLGNQGIRLLLDDLDARYRTRPSRVDMMAHAQAFTPRVVRDAIHAGDYCSRSVTPDKMVFTESAEGDTCYLGMVAKPRGGMKRAGDRVLRVYDRRGPARVELQMHGQYAHGMGAWLRGITCDEWPMLVRACIRHYCDFVNATADKRITRCPLLDWWSAFVEHAEKISVRVSDDPLEGTPIGKLDGIFQRYAKRLYAAMQAYGSDWIRQRIERHGRLADHDDVQRLRRELERYRGSGLAGVPDHEDLPPF